MVVFRYLYAPLYFFGFVGGATAIVSSDSSPAWLLYQGALIRTHEPIVAFQWT